ncbi:hypothetical protein ACED96_14195 [Clostridium thermobutyricum]
MNYQEENRVSMLFPLIAFVPNLIINILAIFWRMNLSRLLLNIHNIVSFTLFTCIILTFMIFANPLNIFNFDEIEYSKEKTLPYKVFLIILVLYTLSTFVIFANMRIISISSGIMTYSFYVILHLKRLEFAKAKRDEYKTRFQKKMSGLSEESADRNIFWRYKLWFSPRVKLPMNRRLPPNIFGFILIIFFFFRNEARTITIIGMIYSVYFIITIIEYLTSLYTETKGYCTEVYSFNKRGLEYWTITVIDYKNKRELHFTTSHRPYFEAGDYVRVVSSMFTKRIVTFSSTSEKTY